MTTTEKLFAQAEHANTYFRTHSIPIHANVGKRALSYLVKTDGTWEGCRTGYCVPRSRVQRLLDTKYSVSLDKILSGKESAPRPGEKPRSRSTAPIGGIRYGVATVVETRSETIPARYAVRELSELIPSHDPATWKERTDYPSRCQQRDYSRDKGEQLKVERGAAKLEPRHMLTDAITATSGPPVATPSGVVLGGNGRSMMLILAAKRKKYTPYKRSLSARLRIFGLKAKDLRGLREPVLVREVDIEMSKCAAYSNMLNKDLTQDVDFTTEAVSFSRQLKERHLQELAEIFGDGIETLSDLWQNTKAQREAVRIFEAAGIITAQNRSQWVERSIRVFTRRAREIFEDVLLGAILEDARLIAGARAYTDKILKSIPAFVRMRTLPKEWNLLPVFRQVFRYEMERRATGDRREDFIAQQSFDRAAITDNERRIWDALEMPVRRFSAFIRAYVDRAELEQNSTDAMFGEPAAPSDVLDRLLQGGADVSGLGAAPVAMRSVRARIKRHRFRTPRWRNFLHEIEIPFRLLIWAPPGQGKTRTLSKLVGDEFARLQTRVLWVAAEESRELVAERFRQLRLPVRNIDVLETTDLATIETVVATGRYKFIVVDSYQYLIVATKGKKRSATQVELKELQHRYPDLSWLVVLHGSKDGRSHKGETILSFDSMVNIELRKNMASVIKSKLGPPVTVPTNSLWR